MTLEMSSSRGLLFTLRIVTAVAIIGALNWGLIGIFNWNLVDALFGGGTAEETSVASRVVYTVVGLCGIAAMFMLPATRRTQTREPPGMPTPRAL